MVQGAKSQAQTMFWKNRWYLMACLALNSKAIWRLRRRVATHRGEGWAKELDCQRYLDAVRSNIERHFTNKALD